MVFKETKILDLTIIEPDVFSDNRGCFLESFNLNKFEKNVRKINFIQDNESKSSKGVLRGLHFQSPPYDQSKLVRCVQGEVLDVAVDIRVGSPTFGKWLTFELSEKNKKILYVPEGFAHGYLVKSESSIVSYKCTNIYQKQDEYGIKWDDLDLNIKWECSNPIVSDRDQNMPLLKHQNNLPSYKFI